MEPLRRYFPHLICGLRGRCMWRPMRGWSIRAAADTDGGRLGGYRRSIRRVVSVGVCKQKDTEKQTDTDPGRPHARRPCATVVSVGLHIGRCMYRPRKSRYEARPIQRWHMVGARGTGLGPYRSVFPYPSVYTLRQIRHHVSAANTRRIDPRRTDPRRIGRCSYRPTPHRSRSGSHAAHQHTLVCGLRNETLATKLWAQVLIH
ncbi:hypothetical protein B0J15DRAFT_565551 [Fusarium solani]|uniref:Uncharacterized protein n=1 Tax=Fusarium solani TaxID=169388 RepID=A0A9P9K0U0_FUSSL|nr:uncharacterized protein B0J15DRAFT_565551 [Fusarium solani]KAH7243973.1 hypothetical protein B0J15DRAFT_565551 [Fusarium solani]